jgi:tellurite resistance protein TerC
MSTEQLLWLAFGTIIFVMLALDLGFFHRRDHVIPIKEALLWSTFWIGLALLFNLGVFLWLGKQEGLEFLTAYLVEESLSVDNLFVFILIFSVLGVPALYQHRVLFWGIIGALAMRALMIALGITLIETFHWIIFVFGAFLIVTGVRMTFRKEKEVDPGKNPVLKLVRRLLPVTESYEGSKFFVKKGGIAATPLFVALIAVETTDLVFAVDSIPAVLAITTDPFIVYTSNAFAILGLRSIYFALAGLLPLFRFLRYGLSVILVFVGLKMVLGELYKMPIGIALGVVAAILVVSIMASILMRPAKVAAPNG